MPPCFLFLSQKSEWIYWELFGSFQVATILRFLQLSVSAEKLYLSNSAPVCFKSHVGLSVPYLLEVSL